MILQQIYSGNDVANFVKNCPSFIEDITKKYFGLFFSSHTVHFYSTIITLDVVN